MPGHTPLTVGERAAGITADPARWTRTLPAYTIPSKVVRGVIVNVYATAPGVARIRNDRDGLIVLCRDVQLERKAVRGASV